MGMVSSEAVRKIVNSEEMVYTKPDKRWKSDMCVTKGPQRQKFSFKEVWTVPIVYDAEVRQSSVCYSLLLKCHLPIEYAV
jgi:hypothetical protein